MSSTFAKISFFIRNTPPLRTTVFIAACKLMGLYIFRCGSLFRGSFWNYTSKHIGGIAMAGRKEYRDLTVGDIYRNGKSVPMLRISGLWLEELGFKTGDFVRIKCEDGQLIISLNEEKAQQVAEEKAFME